MSALLSSLSDRDCLRLCHRLLGALCGHEPPRREDYCRTCSPQDWTHLVYFLTTLFRLAVGQELSDQEVLVQLGGTSPQAELVLAALRGRQQEIRSSLLDSTNSICSRTVRNVDWTLKLALSSDKLSSLHTPLLCLRLDIGHHGFSRPVAMEMNREELSTLITSLEAANKVMLQLK